MNFPAINVNSSHKLKNHKLTFQLSSVNFFCFLIISLKQAWFPGSAVLYRKIKVFIFSFLSFFLFFCLFAFLGLLLLHMDVPWLGGLIGAVASSLRQNHSNTGSEMCLQPTPQLTATLNPYPTEQVQESNPQPHVS